MPLHNEAYILTSSRPSRSRISLAVAIPCEVLKILELVAQVSCGICPVANFSLHLLHRRRAS